MLSTSVTGFIATTFHLSRSSLPKWVEGCGLHTRLDFSSARGGKGYRYSIASKTLRKSSANRACKDEGVFRAVDNSFSSAQDAPLRLCPGRIITMIAGTA